MEKTLITIPETASNLPSTAPAEKVCFILSIDAWACEFGGWTWNNWFKVGRIEFDKIPQSNRDLLRWMRNEGYLSNTSQGKVSVEDDGFNIVFKQRSNDMPLFAIEYGVHI